MREQANKGQNAFQQESLNLFRLFGGVILMNKKTHSTHDASAALPGDYARQHKKKGDKAPTQLHQSQRTPGSRSDRDDHLGSHNQSRQRKKGT
jgi:hypothetical protein